MGILDGPQKLVADVKGFISNPIGLPLKGPPPRDFDSFNIEELKQDGGLVSSALNVTGAGSIQQGGNILQLDKDYLPLAPVTFGGDQRLVKEFYPGFDVPTVHVLGPTETDVVIRGRLKDKNFNVPDLLGGIGKGGIAFEFAEKIDAIRKRGNPCKFILGQWIRFGFIKSTKFDMRKLTDIRYQITLDIVGDREPLNCQLLEETLEIPSGLAINLLDLVGLSLERKSRIPESTPASIADLLNSAINTVAEAVTSITSLVDAVITAGEDIGKSVNRILGLIKFVQSEITRNRRRLAKLLPFFRADILLGVTAPERFDASGFTATKRSDLQKVIFDVQKDYSSFREQLLALKARFKALAETVPLARHRVVEGDTLQKLAIKFYGISDLWKKIFDHNKLTSTELVTGVVLEIPKK